MSNDIRASALYREVAQLWDDVRRPGTGQVSDCAQMDVSPDRDRIVFTATVAERSGQEPPTRIALTGLVTRATTIVTHGPHSDKFPQFSPDGRQVAFLSDRLQPGNFQLYLLDSAGNRVRAAPPVDGTVDYLRWSADGQDILLGVTGCRRDGAGLPSWMPAIEPSVAPDQQRGCWIHTLETNTVRPVTTDACSIWDAAWGDGSTLVILASGYPGEDHWYEATLRVLDLRTGRHRELYAPRNQLGTPVVSPAGDMIAIVEALCSDRAPVMGDLKLIEIGSGRSRTVDLQAVDVLNVKWQSDRHLLISGFRGLDTVVGLHDLADATFKEVWSSTDLSVTGACMAGLAAPGDCVIVTEGFVQAPTVALVHDGRYRVLKSFDIGYAGVVRAIATVERMAWTGTDGLEIQGWLLRPHGHAPFPLIVDIHGGPVSHWRPMFMLRRMMHSLILLRSGFAVFLPNPRGGSGRGQHFTQRVLGDLGGGDAADILSGVDALVDDGRADPGRIGVTGVSYGGFMTAWLITQSDRFAAAVAVSPHTNQVTAQLLSNIPPVHGASARGRHGQPGGTLFRAQPGAACE